MSQIQPRKTFIVNIIGGPGVGKSMLACLLFIKLKELGKTVEITFEYAKTLVWNRDFETLNNQYWVSSQQAKILNSMCGNVDFVIIDSSLFSGLYYNQTNPDNTSNVEKTKDMILKEFNKFSNINIFVKRGQQIGYEQEGRIQTLEESNEVQKGIECLLEQHNIPHITYTSKLFFPGVEELLGYILQESQK
jgi:hypothetical protein